MYNQSKQLTHSFSDSKSAEKLRSTSQNYSTFGNRVWFVNKRDSFIQIGGNDSEKSAKNDEEHCHSIVRKDVKDNTARRKLIIAIILCLVFMIAEIVGGTLANSLAIMTDAAHLLSDFASFLISLFAIYLASRPATKRMSFGWHRAEVVGALISVLLIWVVTGILVYIAVNRIIEQTYEIDAKIMLITSGVGVVVNIIMAVSLHPHSHSHGGDNDHENNESSHDTDHAIDNLIQVTSNQRKQNDDVEGRKESDDSTPLLAEVHVTSDQLRNSSSSIRNNNGTSVSRLLNSHSHHNHGRSNINVRAAFIHVIGDLFQSIGVMIAALIIYFKPEWQIADPICTFLFSILVLLTTINILRDTMNVLMEGTPRSLDFDKVHSALLSIPGVCILHNLRIWSLTMGKIALSVHLVIDNTKDVSIVLKEATKLLLKNFNISDVTIQVENYSKKMDDCDRCKGPNK